ncbi:MAG: phosphonoacetaldehyde hydrolase [Geminicoccaceae bacterium]|nr:phosphonoacetaldehyde hydrolase [Geminicoccaceae bacterium]
MSWRWQLRWTGGLEAVLFDLAGTLQDFGSCAPAGVFVQVFAEVGVPISLAEARAPMGAEKRAHLRALLFEPAIAARFTAAHGRTPTESDVDRLYAAFVPAQLAVLERHAELVPGALETVRALRAKGVKIAVNTGYSREMLERCLAAARAQGLEVDDAVAASDVPRARPRPAMCLLNAARLGVSDVAACLKVDDTVPGIEEGLAAGMWTVAVAVSGNEVGLPLPEWRALPGHEQARLAARAADRLARAGAHVVIDSVAQLLPVVADIEARLARGERP